nr:IS66 family insertion sequence element accessory protein TnpB [Agrobacterium salinitolerans]
MAPARTSVATGCCVAVGDFIPALVVPEGEPAAGSLPNAGRMEVVSANGRRVIVGRDVDVEALLRILRGLEALR